VGNLDPASVASWPINRQPLSSGEFMLERWDNNRSLSLVRNPRYPGRAALLERVVFRILPEANTRLLALESGEVDLVDGLDPDGADRLARSGRVDIIPAGGRSFYYLGWNFRNPAFADRETRQALDLALDRELMVATLLKGYGRPAVGPIPPVLWNHHGGLTAVPHDPVRARALLAAAGWRDSDGDGVIERGGVPFSFEIITKQGDPVRENAAVILRANLAEVGVAVSLRVLEHASGLAQIRAGRYDAYLGLLNANLFGNPAPYVGSDGVDQFNFGMYANAEVDSLLAVATGPLTREEALPLWLRLQEVLMADPPAAYLMYPDNLVGASHRVHDVRPHLLSPWNNLASWWIAPADRIYRTGS
jgi:peptide/nickel transport system substrate-binding protein